MKCASRSLILSKMARGKNKRNKDKRNKKFNNNNRKKYQEFSSGYSKNQKKAVESDTSSDDEVENDTGTEEDEKRNENTIPDEDGTKSDDSSSDNEDESMGSDQEEIEDRLDPFLYADFYSADIIVASPLGLRVIIGAEGEVERDYDFLASIEVLILDQADIFLMQNWDHLLHVLDHIHLQPQEAHGTNFSRVRSWALNGWTRYYKQTLLFSSVMLPEFSSLMNKRCHNYAGKICIMNPVTTGSICQLVVQVPQVFQRFEVESVAQSLDARFDYFVKKILSEFKNTVMNHVLIYVPSYFDYVRLRNHFKREDLNFVQICEYSKDGKVARARDMFFHAEAHFLLYSERFHFFRRPTIKGIQHILFYQPPTFPNFYSEMCNFMQEINQPKHGGNESNMTVTVLYSKYDVQQLAAIVGTDRAARMVNSERNVHMFMTGE
ncbi:Digestive organ expansion factor [Blattella germanica]|nr:Digestive organ expansion factor [Blattella germanica]